MLVPGEYISLLYSKWLLYQAAGSCLFSCCFLQAERSLNTQHKVYRSFLYLFQTLSCFVVRLVYRGVSSGREGSCTEPLHFLGSDPGAAHQKKAFLPSHLKMKYKNMTNCRHLFLGGCPSRLCNQELQDICDHPTGIRVQERLHISAFLTGQLNMAMDSWQPQHVARHQEIFVSRTRLIEVRSSDSDQD